MTKRTNMQRAIEGLHLCTRMRELTGVDTVEDQIADIMCQLMHTCRLIKDEEGKTIDFNARLDSARMNFEAEVEEDDDC